MQRIVKSRSINSTMQGFASISTQHGVAIPSNARESNAGSHRASDASQRNAMQIAKLLTSFFRKGMHCKALWKVKTCKNTFTRSDGPSSSMHWNGLVDFHKNIIMAQSHFLDKLPARTVLYSALALTRWGPPRNICFFYFFLPYCFFCRNHNLQLGHCLRLSALPS